MQKLINEYINCLLQCRSRPFFTNVCHSLTVSNSQVYSNDEFDLWPVYSGERFRPLGPFVFFFLEKATKPLFKI